MEIGGLHIFGVSPAQEALLRGREAFVKKYCSEKDWDIDNLSIEQIMEIRKQDGWKCPSSV